ncbi:hypothetical protein [Streptomyces sp. 8N706]|uniref:hypothetical protein n=1 Tax=Streptomyces sp. 8N706 TaxID=3457416 RepID=UPI003FD21427
MADTEDVRQGGWDDGGYGGGYEGGEGACQLHRVCTECGRINERADGGSCEACGAALPGGR